MTSPLQRLDELLGRRVSMRALALLRILIGPVVVMHLQPFLERAADGLIYRDVFHEPYLSWYPALPRSLYVAVLVVGALGAVAMTVGFFTRAATVVVFAAVTYNLFLSTTHYHNNRAYLVIVLATLAIVPCGRELSVDAWLRRRRGLPALDPSAPGWPLWLVRFEAAVVYGASGLSKLVDPDWFGGAVTWDRVARVQDLMAARSVPGWAIDIVVDRGFHTYAAKVIVITELFIAFGLWWRTTRYAAVWVAVCFHVAIELTASVQVFSYLGIAALLVWAVPSTRDRTLEVDLATPAGRRVASVVHRLDWLARFAVVGAPHGRTGEGPARVTDRDGTVYDGFSALALIASRLPLTAWFALPLLLLPSVRRARRAPPLVPAAA
jgi:hypothetical protein